jgi:hypothetical protein
MTMHFNSQSRRLIPILATLLTVLSTAPSYAEGLNSNPGVLPPNSNPFGKSYGQWGAEWWKWVYAQPFSKNPVFDATGEFCAEGQSGKVWFLAGSFGGTVTRTCAVPKGKAIFFPIYNIFNDYPCPDATFKPAPGQSLEDFLTNGTGQTPGARDLIDPANPRTDFAVTVDGQQLSGLGEYRATSRLAAFTGNTSLQVIDACITGSSQLGVSDGYWIMLAPLTPGQHTLRIEAHVFNPVLKSQFDLDVSYHLMVS